MDKISYRLANASDVESLVSLRAAFLAEVGPCDPILLAALREYFTIHVASGAFVAWLADADGQIVASSGLVFHQNPPSASNLSGREPYIMNLYTLPAWRGRGIATELLRRLIAVARDSGGRRVALHALPMGRSIYVKAGFVPCDKEMRLELKNA